MKFCLMLLDSKQKKIKDKAWRYVMSYQKRTRNDCGMSGVCFVKDLLHVITLTKQNQFRAQILTQKSYFVFVIC